MTKKIVWRGVIPTTNFCVHHGSSTIRITLNKENVYDETVLLAGLVSSSDFAKISFYQFVDNV